MRYINNEYQSTEDNKDYEYYLTPFVTEYYNSILWLLTDSINPFTEFVITINKNTKVTDKGFILEYTNNKLEIYPNLNGFYLIRDITFIGNEDFNYDLYSYDSYSNFYFNYNSFNNKEVIYDKFMYNYRMFLRFNGSSPMSITLRIALFNPKIPNVMNIFNHLKFENGVYQLPCKYDFNHNSHTINSVYFNRCGLLNAINCDGMDYISNPDDLNNIIIKENHPLTIWAEHSTRTESLFNNYDYESNPHNWVKDYPYFITAYDSSNSRYNTEIVTLFSIICRNYDYNLRGYVDYREEEHDIIVIDDIHFNYNFLKTRLLNDDFQVVQFNTIISTNLPYFDNIVYIPFNSYSIKRWYFTINNKRDEAKIPLNDTNVEIYRDGNGLFVKSNSNVNIESINLHMILIIPYTSS